ncbi:DUF2273 domain-containing protein [Rubrobacter aplysinae]|uniref:DUF2273 domain-containing protein n=1 Tax=Rubrobacter aplysinae TaxID=909625 RepID=UPI00064C28E9|nr:hypothetical protein [Rubrobacter aplysinae]
MQYWTNKHWGALFGALVVLFIGLVGVGLTALAVLAGLLGYFIGKFLDGELSLQEIQYRAQGRTRYPEQGQGPPRPPRVD